MNACWKPMFNLFREEYHYNCKSHVFSYYDKVTSSNKKMLQLLKSNSKEDLEKETLMYFKRYIKGLDGPSLWKLVQFLTESDVVVVDKIDIAYYKPDNEFCRRPFFHTFGSCLELPTPYNNFCEESHQVLQKQLVGIRYCLMTWLLMQSSLLTLTA